MKHSPAWYDQLAQKLGHRGFLTLAEIRDAEREEREGTASHGQGTSAS